jgi:hypothetical protein
MDEEKVEDNQIENQGTKLYFTLAPYNATIIIF